jgi:hypothetical protein
MHSAIIRARKPGLYAYCGVQGCCTPDEKAVDPTTTIAESKAASPSFQRS